MIHEVTFWGERCQINQHERLELSFRSTSKFPFPSTPSMRTHMRVRAHTPTHTSSDMPSASMSPVFQEGTVKDRYTYCRYHLEQRSPERCGPQLLCEDIARAFLGTCGKADLSGGSLASLNLHPRQNIRQTPESHRDAASLTPGLHLLPTPRSCLQPSYLVKLVQGKLAEAPGARHWARGVLCPLSLACL